MVIPLLSLMAVLELKYAHNLTRFHAYLQVMAHVELDLAVNQEAGGVPVKTFAAVVAVAAGHVASAEMHMNDSQILLV